MNNIDDKGFMEFAIKSYPNGIVSSYLDSLTVGQTIDVKGPITKFTYKPNMKKSIGMLAGGSGLTPMLQVIVKVTNSCSCIVIIII